MIWIDQNWMKEDQIHNFAKNYSLHQSASLTRDIRRNRIRILVSGEKEEEEVPERWTPTSFPKNNLATSPQWPSATDQLNLQQDENVWQQFSGSMQQMVKSEQSQKNHTRTHTHTQKKTSVVVSCRDLIIIIPFLSRERSPKQKLSRIVSKSKLQRCCSQWACLLAEKIFLPSKF